MRRLVGCAVLALCAGCPSEKKEAPDAGPPGPKQLTEKEPNDRPEQAQLIDDSSIVSASLTADPSKPDEDWYLLQSAAPKTVDVSVSGIPGGDVQIEVYDTDRNRLAVVNSEGEGKPERIPNLGLKGKLLIKVTTAKKGAGGAYTLQALFNDVAPGFEAEPNDRAVDANAAQLGQSLQGFIGHVADEDWYRYDLPVPDSGVEAPAEDGGAGMADAGAADAGAAAAAAASPSIALRIELSGVDGVRYDLSVLSAAEAPLFNVKGKESEPLSLRNIGVRANDRVVYLVVKSGWIGTGKDAHRGYNANSPYTLTVSQEEAGASAELEPNDDWQHATPLTPNGFREGFLSPKGDVDYYVLKTDAPVLAHFKLDVPERVDLELALVKPGENGKDEALLTADDGKVKEPEILNDVFCANECYLRVQSAPRKGENGKYARDYENSEQPYRLSVSVAADTGAEEREPNEKAEQATPIALGRPIRGTIQPKRDQDWFKLDLTGRPVKTALKATLTGILKVHVGLYMHRQEAEGKTELVQTADGAKGDAPEVIRFSAEPGVYFFVVKDTQKAQQSNFQDSYQLTVEEAE